MKMNQRKPTFAYALLTMIAVFSVIMIPALMWGSKINGLFLIAWVVAMIFCLFTGTPYQKLQKGMVANCTKAIVPIMIVLSVGALVGTWNAAGTVPVVISFGVQTVTPQYFLMTAFLLCVVTALVTGTSWGTFGTAGLALAGIGVSLNIDPIITAGAVCGGAFFGDTISPLSDSPNLSSAVSGVDLFRGIRHQAVVTVPAAVISIVLYFFIGLQYREGTVDTSLIQDIVGAVENNFNTGLVTLLPMALVVVLLAKKVPSIPAILSGSIGGGLIACLFQGKTLADVIRYFWSGYEIESGVAFVDKLLNRGGVTSMTSTAVMFLFAFGLFGILSAAGIVDALVEPVTKHLHTKMSLVGTSVLMSILGTIVGASMNFAYAFAGSIMAPIFDKRGLHKLNLMRGLGVGCTAMAVLVPWSLSSAVAVQFLNVEPIQLIPYNFFLFVSPIVLVVVTLLGFDTKWNHQLSEKEQKREEETNMEGVEKENTKV